MSADTERASAILLEFMAAMKEWENKFAPLYKQDGALVHAGQAKIELQAICEKYLTKRERKYGRMAGPSVGWPPEFDPDAEKIVATQSADDRKVIFETLWTHPTAVPTYTTQHRFTMVCKHGEWRLDRKEEYSSHQGKWTGRVL